MGQIRKALRAEKLEDNSDEDDEDESEVNGEETYDLPDDFQDINGKKQIDDLLLDFFSNSYKIPQVNVIDPSQYEESIGDLVKVLKLLKAKLCIPENLDDIEHLDSLDIRILNTLSARKNSEYNHLTVDQQLSAVQELIPPHLHSVVGLRSLLIRHLHFKNSRRRIPQLASNNKNLLNNIRQIITTDILSCTLNDRMDIETERNLFYRRFHSVMKWPALMTIQNPTAELLNISDFLPVKNVKAVKRTYSRISNGGNNESSKKSKTSQPRTESSNVIKLTPVSNKSVIEDLLKDKSKKLFSLSNINKNGQIKAVINEIKLDFSESEISKIKKGDTLTPTPSLCKMDVAIEEKPVNVKKDDSPNKLSETKSSAMDSFLCK